MRLEKDRMYLRTARAGTSQPGPRSILSSISIRMVRRLPLTFMWHDNSSENRNNPDPDAQITYGLRTVDEMSSAWLSYYYMSEEEFKAELAQRKAKQQTLTSQR